MELEAVRDGSASTTAGEITRPELKPRLLRQYRRRLSHENRVLLLALASGVAPLGLALFQLWSSNHEFGAKWSLTFLLTAVWLGFAFALRSAVIRPLQTLSNMLAALGEGDFSFRVRGATRGSALGQLTEEVNALSEMLQEQRLGAVEAGALLTTVMTEIEVAVFAFDGDRKLRLVNRAGERVMAQNAGVQARGAGWVWRNVGGRVGAHAGEDLSWTIRAVGSAAVRVPAGWEAALPHRNCRFEPRLARGRAASVAATGSCARP